MTIKAKKSKINLREKLAELLNFRQIRDRLDGLGLYLGKDRTGTAENLAVRGGASIDDLQLAEISAALGDTAVDVFVYDTRNDSDGGKWRERTQNTSWYNEELNTATRGGRREFPAVAVIVAETDKVTIYDGDDPDLPMWMVFQSGDKNALKQSPITSIFILNGLLLVGSSISYGMNRISFIKDNSNQIFTLDRQRDFLGSIADRNTQKDWGGLYSAGGGLVNDVVNDVAMTVLPNAPIDADTGLPIPTIAVATDGGVSVIKDDGSVISNSDSDYLYVNDVYIDNNYIYASSGKQGSHSPFLRILNYKGTNLTEYHRYSSSRGGIDYPLLANGALNGFPDGWIIDGIGKNKAFGGQATNVDSDSIIGLTLLEEEISNPSLGMVAYTTSSYNTGWMPGDIKLATLSDTKIETVGEENNPQLVTNGQFNSDVSGWTNIDPSGSPDATITWSNGTAQVFRPTGQLGRFSQAIDTIVGAEYFIQIGNYGGSNGGVFVADSNDGNSWNIIANNGAVIKDNNKHYFTATTTSTYIVLNSSLENQSVTFDDISVKRSGELVTNGTFDDGTAGWSDQWGSVSSTISVTNNKLTVNATSNYGGVRVDDGYLPQIIQGRTYVMTVDIDSISTGAVRFGTVSGFSSSDFTTPGVHTGTFVFPVGANLNDIFIDNSNSGASTFTINSVSLRLAEDDRSVNDNGLQVFGEITKTPVAPGADLVAYSGFSADNYLVQPYNSDLDFGTGDFCIMCWGKKTTSSAYEEIFARSTPSSIDQCLILQWTPSGAIRFFTQNSGSSYVDSVFDADDKGWHFITAIRRSGVLELYINAVLDIGFNQDNGVKDVGAGFISSIGYRVADSTHPATNSSIALFRISATAPTPEQIAKIYRDEKVLFQDGAGATLYGTSDAVTALAYDDKTELLHVGTSGGRSDFAGLRRINNTTTAVTTSISASNNLIAEQ